jgi:hypothetical protein
MKRTTKRLPVAKAFSEATIGSEFKIEVIAKAPAHLRWRKDSDLKNIEVGKLAHSQPWFPKTRQTPLSPEWIQDLCKIAKALIEY